MPPSMAFISMVAGTSPLSVRKPMHSFPWDTSISSSTTRTLSRAGRRTAAAGSRAPCRGRAAKARVKAPATRSSGAEPQ